MRNLTVVESMLRKLHDSSREITVRFPGSTKGFILKNCVVFHKHGLRSNS